MSTERIGWIGLGNIGKPMVQNLINAGFNVQVYNRTASKADELTGSFKVSENVIDLVSKSDIIFTMVTADEAIKDIYEQVWKAGDLSDKLFIDMSTISKDLSVQTAKDLKAKNAKFIDAPVLGSVKPATEGTLVIVAGGDESDVERARPYFEKMGKAIKHHGPNGAGIATKIAVNYYISILYLSLAETTLLAEKNGISRAQILDSINESASGSGATKVKTAPLVNEDFAPAFTLDLMLKDVKLAEAAGANFPLTESLANAYQNAQEQGLGDLDVIGVIEYLKEL